MKILHVISSGGMYGAEAVILNLSRALQERSHRSMLGVFANSLNPNLQLHEIASTSGLESHAIICNSQIDFSAVSSIRKLAARTEADVVHAHGYKGDIYTYFALRGSQTPYVSTCHNWLRQNWMTSLYGVADRRMLRHYAGVVAVSDEVKQRLLRAGVSEEKIHMVRNGIDLRPFAAAPPSLERDPEDLVIGWVGRLSHEKGADILVSAAAQVLEKVPLARFVVVGEGPDQEKLTRLVTDLGIQDRVSMIGRREDMPGVYASFDVMVSSSRQEGLPMAILEGMATGLPLIATAVGDVPTIVRDRITGLLVPSEDVDRLAAAILELLFNPMKRAKLGATAKQLIVDEYSAERMTTEYLRVYEEAIQTVKRERTK